jgi:hypothetical protein
MKNWHVPRPRDSTHAECFPDKPCSPDLDDKPLVSFITTCGMVERTVLGEALNLLPIDHLPSWSSAPPICAAAAHLLRDGFIRAIGARPQAPMAAKARRLHPRPLAQNDQGAMD